MFRGLRVIGFDHSSRGIITVTALTLGGAGSCREFPVITNGGETRFNFNIPISERDVGSKMIELAIGRQALESVDGQVDYHHSKIGSRREPVRKVTAIAAGGW
jgi:hypothetical protein